MVSSGFTKKIALSILLAGLPTIVGCALLGNPVTAGRLEKGKRVIHMNASNFEFEPNNLRIPKPGPVTLAVENISNTEHNFTIKNPKGQVLKSVDLPPKKKTSITFDLPEPGKYAFYCDKPFHASFGMKGQIQVDDE
jgi:uncharacterized cupredoxin-like copper-binding protein